MFWTQHTSFHGQIHTPLRNLYLSDCRYLRESSARPGCMMYMIVTRKPSATSSQKARLSQWLTWIQKYLPQFHRMIIFSLSVVEMGYKKSLRLFNGIDIPGGIVKNGILLSSTSHQRKWMMVVNHAIGTIAKRLHTFLCSSHHPLFFQSA